MEIAHRWIKALGCLLFSHLVVKTLQGGKHMLEVDLTITVWLPAARHLGNLQHDILMKGVVKSIGKYLHMPNNWQEVFDVPGEVAFDLLQVEHIQLKPDPGRVQVLDKLDGVLVAVHVVVGHDVRVDWLDQPDHPGRLE